MKKLFAKQGILKETDHYPIFDENDKDVYFVDQDPKLMRNKIMAYDKDRKLNFEVFHDVFVLFSKYRIRFTDGRELKISGKITPFKKFFGFSINGKESSVRGDFVNRNFNIFYGQNLIGSVKKDLLSPNDICEIEILDESRQDLVIAIMVTIDAILDCQKKES